MREKKLELLSHTFVLQESKSMVKCMCIVNQSIYSEMVLSSKHLTYTSSLHDQNNVAIEGIMRMLGVEPNPNFIFKGTSIENERYLIYRFMISIFQLPSDKLYHFQDEQIYRQFCEKYNEEFHSQEWFKTTFYKGSWEDAIDYFTQNSLIFQELYFPSNGFQRIDMPFLSDITTSYQGKQFKKDFREIYSILDQKGIGKLYHFTDASNIESIKKHGLVSNHKLKELHIHTKYSSTPSSREADAQMGLDDFVRLSFVKTHPMLYTAMTSQGIRPAIIEINPLIALMPQVYFSNNNALRTGANIGDSYADLNKVRFDIVLGSRAYYDLSLEEKRLYQAEILVKERIGPEFILNYKSLT
jgi:hypothetical protein